MATVAELESQINALKSEGKSESNSKSYAKLVGQLEEAKQTDPGYRAQQDYMKAIEPAVKGLQEQIPLTQQLYQTQIGQVQAEKDPLIARYESLLSDITGNQEQAVNSTTLAQSNELARRGIASQSGLGEQTINQAVNPVLKDYADLLTQTGLARESDLRNLDNQIANLTNQQGLSVNQINQAIAQLQSSANTGALDYALQLANQTAQQDQFQQQFGLSQSQFDQMLKQYEEITKPQALADINLTNTKAQTATGTGGVEKILADIVNNLNPQQQNNKNVLYPPGFIGPIPPVPNYFTPGGF